MLLRRLMLHPKCLKNLCKIKRRFSAVSCNQYDHKLYKLDPINLVEPKFEKVLISNRGEIACRIIRTAKAMGMKTVAVHSEADNNSLHVQFADEAICIGKAPATESYLVVERILDAVSRTGADCVHPGYGFLSENTHFAKALSDSGVAFIGPNSKAILDMGDKINSKRIATSSGVNMIPGYDGEIQDEEECIRIANEIGYPVMIKASAGGGGKGMRIAWSDAEARGGFKFSRQEAAAAFGDARLLVEKFIDRPRHIEVQVLCDRHGSALWLNERECSIQRRNQKLVEEAPSSFVDADLRRAMGEQAVQLAKAVGYDSAGTVEFLVDSKKNFYFLEMNTRLQVEHPITEQITGVDLVQQMFRVAYGHPLNIRQADVGINGWAFECRVYAEDPYKDFGLPSIGHLTKYKEPFVGSSNATDDAGTIRCDSGVREGSEISIYYDPLICKLVSHGTSRSHAQHLMNNALDCYVIRGLSHNIPLLCDIFGEEKFSAGDVNTNYLPETYPHGFSGVEISELERNNLLAIAGLIHAFQWNWAALSEASRSEFNFVGLFEESDSEDSAGDAFRKSSTLSVKLEDGIYAKDLCASVKIDGNDEFKLVKRDGINLSQTLIDLKINNSPVVVQFLNKSPSGISLIYKGSAFHIKIYSPEAFACLKYMKAKPKADPSTTVLSPMPGTIKSVSVHVGDLVSIGQELCVIEAMKMQNSLHAAKTGKVKAVNCKVGEKVDDGALLVELE